VGVMGEAAGGVARVIGACSCQHSSGSVSCALGVWEAAVRHARHSLRRLGQKAYQVLAAHGRLRRAAGIGLQLSQPMQLV
jgi:hypothetical protein